MRYKVGKVRNDTGRRELQVRGCPGSTHDVGTGSTRGRREGTESTSKILCRTCTRRVLPKRTDGRYFMHGGEHKTMDLRTNKRKYRV